ncbi:S24 family peptidase [Acidithiobacillus ferrivorans]|uniref:S24 family peptidase n=1 Tax=Acidithiobacillus ferrivorans TaxID=160808 RepID=A0A7T4WC91_9PROT|nr:S24 family peptidase [Acidithiobacillus ferrivorans]QQD71914.1 S24 family peptidase [Acidithiobacillus ferrivorans]
MLVSDLVANSYYSVMDYKENRKANLKVLVEEYGSVRDLVEAISARLGQEEAINTKYLAQVLSGFQGSKDRRPRSLGDVAAGRIEKGLGKPANWMDQDHSAPMSGTAPTLSGNAPVIAWSDAEGPPPGMVTVPRLRMSLSMGTGKIMFETEEHEEGNAFRADWLASMCLKPGSCFMAKVEGASMEPKLEEGESVLIDRAQTLIIDRKIYAISYDGKIYCKRLFKAGIEVIMRSDNSEFPEIRAAAEEVQIIGRVVWHAGSL